MISLFSFFLSHPSLFVRLLDHHQQTIKTANFAFLYATQALKILKYIYMYSITEILHNFVEKNFLVIQKTYISLKNYINRKTARTVDATACRAHTKWLERDRS